MIRKNPRGDLPQVPAAASEFSEGFAGTKNELVCGYKHIQNQL